MTNKRNFGQASETAAVEYLRGKGYEIIGRNWRCNLGELDIIARQGETIVFVEVRARHTDSPSAAFESVNPRKQSKLIQLAYRYLDAHNLSDADWRIDVIAIASPRRDKFLIEHAENALEW
jgi:putative endonuclease